MTKPINLTEVLERMKEYNGTLYDYTAGAYCGVLVTEKVMKKLAKLQAEHLAKIKRLLGDSVGEVFPSSWTLHYPNGEQTIVRYIDGSADLSERIDLAVIGSQPRACHPVFFADSMDEARKLADERHAAQAHGVKE